MTRSSWRSRTVAALAVAWERRTSSPDSRPGRSLLEPAIRTARALDRLSAQSRAALRARLEQWLDAQVAKHLALAEDAGRGRDRPGEASPGVRAIAAMLADAGGVLPRKAMLSAIAHLEQADRQALHRLRVRLGPLDVFLPPLLKPAAQHWRAALLAVRSNQPMPRSARGRRGDAGRRCRSARRGARLPPARPRMAAHRPCRPARQPCPPGALGGRGRAGRCRARDLARPQRGGDRAADGGSRLHPGRRRLALARPARRPPRPPAAPSHAFAELAKLKRPRGR